MEATTQSEASRETCWVFRVGGVSAIAGAIIGLVGNLLHPQTAGPGDPEQTARVVADSRIWVPLHLALLVAFLLMLGGLVAIGASISGGPAGALARFGFAAAIVGTTAGVIDVTLDGFAAKHLAERWMSAPPKARATAPALPVGGCRQLRAAQPVESRLRRLHLRPVRARDGAYPWWLAWTVAVVGAGGAISGGIQASVGEPTGITEALGIAAPTIITLWLLVMGILLLRRQREPVDPNAIAERPGDT